MAGPESSDEDRVTPSPFVEPQKEDEKFDEVKVSIKDESGSKSPLSRVGKYLKTNLNKLLHTLILYLVMLGMGSMHTVVGPTLIDLSYNLNASVDQISFIFICQGIGFVVGTISGGIAIDKVPKALFLIVVTGLTALITVSIPWWPTVWLLCICFFLRGCSIRALEIGCNVALLELWGVESSMPMQGLHFFLAIGSALGPLLVTPFLGEEVEIRSSNYTSYNSTSSKGIELVYSGEEDKVVNDLESSKVELAYVFIGIYLGSIALISLIIYFVFPPKHIQQTSIMETEEEEENPLDTSEEKKKELWFKIKFIGIGTTVLFLYFGSILSFDSYLNIFCVKSQLHMTQKRGATLGICFWGAFVLARFFACFYSGVISDLKIIIVDLVGIVISSIPMSIFVEFHESILWITVISYGLFMASLGPAAISYTNRFINVSGKIAAIYMLGAALGETAAPMVIGQLFKLTPMVLMYTVTTISILLVPLSWGEIRIAKKHGQKPDALVSDAQRARKKSLIPFQSDA